MIQRIRFRARKDYGKGRSVVMDVEIEKDPDGWWGYLPDGWYFTDDPCCTARHEDTKAELMQMLRGGYEIDRE